MRADALAGVLAGLAVAMPIGAIGTYLVGLAARARFRVAVAAALGVATTDGCYALLAGTGIAGVERAVGALGDPLRAVAAALLVGLAVRTVVLAVRQARADTDPSTDSGHLSRRRRAGSGQASPGNASTGSRPQSGLRTYASMVGLTAVNPATIATFAAVVGGHRLSGSPLWLATTVFAVGAFAASAAWQLTLVGAGTALGRVLSGRRGRLVVASASAAVMVGLAVLTVSG